MAFVYGEKQTSGDDKGELFVLHWSVVPLSEKKKKKTKKKKKKGVWVREFANMINCILVL